MTKVTVILRNEILDSGQRRVIAFFPEEFAGFNAHGCALHGYYDPYEGHGACLEDYIRDNTFPVYNEDDDECQYTIDCMKKLGYDLDVRKRTSYKMRRKWLDQRDAYIKELINADLERKRELARTNLSRRESGDDLPGERSKASGVS